MNRLFNFYLSVRDELVKVTWPSKEATVKNTRNVFIFALLLTLLLGVLNLVFGTIKRLFI